ncbi:hypothetical protein [Pedobacter boryungensis]|uniref:Uncharacterized protein n=1 Tax=Pedobacter boryungensis TaxID=869962 RepID=A0ABX2DHR3_9SPHI|nr:hypothetical protein [Pedobacter boryungensis]NQX32486.1 hypothetical protein [Pedobacter boryungensis]
MYRKDLITAEIEKLAQVLAKIIGLKTELKLKEAEDLFNETIISSFGLDSSLLLESDNEGFINWLKKSNHNTEKLNALTDFIYSELDFENNPISSTLCAQKLNLIYQSLIDDHQIVHLINLGRQKMIQQYLSN